MESTPAKLAAVTNSRLMRVRRQPPRQAAGRPVNNESARARAGNEEEGRPKAGEEGSLETAKAGQMGPAGRRKGGEDCWGWHQAWRGCYLFGLYRLLVAGEKLCGCCAG